MNLTIQRASRRTSGHLLLASMLVTVVIAFLAVAYLKLVQSQNSFTTRSQVWDGCIPIAEAGIEEAMAHLNNMTAMNLAANGWAPDALNGGASRERQIGEGHYQANIVITSIALEQATITCTGYLPAPVTVAGSGRSLLASLLPIPSSLSKAGQRYISRTIQVKAQRQPFWAKGMVAKHDINLNGNNVFVDSFDSLDPNASGVGGAYDPAKNKDNGDIATNSGLNDPLNTGNAEIMGNVSTGPGGNVAIGPNGAIGSKAWVLSNSGIEPGYSSDDMNVGFMDVQRPFTGGGFTPTSGIYNGLNYTYALGSGNYQMNALSMSGSQKMVITGNAILYVAGNVDITGKAFIEIAPGATLDIYVAGASANFAGNGVANYNATATSFRYYGLPSNYNLAFAGNAAFTGAIYAPNADFALGGGGNNTYDFVGASVTKSVLMNGHFNFHYDEALAAIGPKTSYTITAWNEI